MEFFEFVLFVPFTRLEASSSQAIDLSNPSRKAYNSFVVKVSNRPDFRSRKMGASHLHVTIGDHNLWPTARRLLAGINLTFALNATSTSTSTSRLQLAHHDFVTHTHCQHPIFFSLAFHIILRARSIALSQQGWLRIAETNRVFTWNTGCETSKSEALC